MCKVCDKSIYFDTTWYWADAGYGDNDEGGDIRNVTSAFICPACGKLKLKSVESRFGSVHKALVYLMLQNMPENMIEEDKIKEFKEILDDSDTEYCKLVLEKMGLTFENGILKHKCGYVIVKGVKADDNIMLLDRLEGILTNKKMNFCPCCGGKIAPFKRDIEMEVPGGVQTFEVGRRKTWDRFLGQSFKPEKEFH